MFNSLSGLFTATVTSLCGNFIAMKTSLTAIFLEMMHSLSGLFIAMTSWCGTLKLRAVNLFGSLLHWLAYFRHFVPLKPDWRRPNVNVFLVFSLLIGGPIFVAALLMAWSNLQVDKPFQSLEAFINDQEVSRHLPAIESLPVESIKSFAGASCIQGPDLPSMQTALRRQLRSLPSAVVEEVVENALIERMSIQSSTQDTILGVESDGHASTYMAFWSTTYVDVASPISAPTYSTCVLVSGMSLNVGEEVAAWEQTKDKKVVGTEPCHCGLLWCEKCPMFKEVTTRRPIMKRHRLTVKNQMQLHEWMKKEAIDKGRALVDGRNGNTLVSWLPFKSLQQGSVVVDDGDWASSVRPDTFLGTESSSWSEQTTYREGDDECLHDVM